MTIIIIMEKKRRHGGGRKSLKASSSSSSDAGPSKPFSPSPYKGKIDFKQPKPQPSTLVTTTRQSRKRKTELSFDESERKDFLTGFQKRKAERKHKAKADNERLYQAEKKRISAQQHEKLKQLYLDNRLATDLDLNSESIVEYQTPTEQTVVIKGLDLNSISSSAGLTLGLNKPKVDVEEDQEEEDAGSNDDEDEPSTSSSIRSASTIKANLKQIRHDAQAQLSASQAMRTRSKLTTKKDKIKKKYGSGKSSLRRKVKKKRGRKMGGKGK